MTNISRRLALPAAILFTTFILPAAFSQDSPLKVEIKMAPEIVANKQLFTLDATVRNTSDVEQFLQTSQCYPGYWHWSTDNPAVHVEQKRDIICKKNPLMYIKLKPGEAYERALSIRVSVPTGETMQSVTFRVGCRIRLEHNLLTELPPYIWSGPASIKVGEKAAQRSFPSLGTNRGSCTSLWLPTWMATSFASSMTSGGTCKRTTHRQRARSLARATFILPDMIT